MKRTVALTLTIAALTGLTSLTAHADDKKDKPTIDERFEFLDTNDDDELSLKEFSQARFLDDNSKKHIDKIFDRYDKNSDEALRPREFETGIETHHPHHYHRHHHHAKGNGDGKSKSDSKGKSGGKSGGGKRGKGSK